MLQKGKTKNGGWLQTRIKEVSTSCQKLAEMFRAMLNPLFFGTVILCDSGWVGKSLAGRTAGRMLLHRIARVHSRLFGRTPCWEGVTITRVNYYAISARSLTTFNVCRPCSLFNALTSVPPRSTSKATLNALDDLANASSDSSPRIVN